jgi:hypothetical protein
MELADHFPPIAEGDSGLRGKSSTFSGFFSEVFKRILEVVKSVFVSCTRPEPFENEIDLSQSYYLWETLGN